MLTQLKADEREAFLEQLAHEVTPSIEFFLYAMLSGLLVGLGFRFDQRALLVVGALLGPRMKPVVGMALSAISGSARFFLRVLAALVVGVLLMAGIAGISGGLGADGQTQWLLAVGHIRLNLIDFSLLLMGAIWMVYDVSRGEALPPIASAAVVYEVALPVGVAGVGLVLGDVNLWQGALLTAGLHLTWAVVAGIAAFTVLGFRPLTGSSGSLAASIVIMGVVALVGAMGLGASVLASMPTPPPTPTATGTHTPPPSPTYTASPTWTGTATQTPTATYTSTPTPTATPVVAIIDLPSDQAGRLRDEPDGVTIGLIAGSDPFEIIGGPTELDGDIWWLVRSSQGLEGWLLGELLATVTPTPSITPTPTLTASPTLTDTPAPPPTTTPTTEPESG